MQNRGEAKEAARELIWDEGGGRQTGKFGTRFLNMESFSGYERNNVPEPQTAEHGGDGGSDRSIVQKDWFRDKIQSAVHKACSWKEMS